MAGALIRVAIVDDHPVVAEGTAALLGDAAGIEVVGVASSLHDAGSAGLFDQNQVDVLLLDIRLGTESGLTALSPAFEPSGSRPEVIMLTAYDYPQYADAALSLGAAGFILKTAPLTELVDAIRRVAEGGLAYGVRPRFSAVRLTPREHDVVRLVVDGRSNDEVANQLGIGSKTVESHLARLFDRLQIASRTELATRALREGWLETPPATGDRH